MFVIPWLENAHVRCLERQNAHADGVTVLPTSVESTFAHRCRGTIPGVRAPQRAPASGRPRVWWAQWRSAHTNLQCLSTWSGHLPCSRRLPPFASIDRAIGRGRRIQRPTVLPHQLVCWTLFPRCVRAGLPPRRGSLELRKSSVDDRVRRTGASSRP